MLYTQSKEAEDPFAYLYRGVSLKYAAERDLYFRFVNDARLFDFYRQWKQKDIPGSIGFFSNLEIDMAL